MSKQLSGMLREADKQIKLQWCEPDILILLIARLRFHLLLRRRHGLEISGHHNPRTLNFRGIISVINRPK